ncbi:Thiol:disulfide interchange protein DsbD [uncultured archaeon]|nr:Thiol:disulfide interchange protein DsbD [uncultured archaeon]
MKTKKLLSIIVLILIIAFAFVSYETALSKFRLSDKNYTYLADLTWHRQFDKGLQIAQEENKPVAIYFWAVWCQYCAAFQTNTLGNAQINKMLKEDYVLMAMDLDVDKDVAQKFGVSYPPVVVFLDANGKEVDRTIGAVDAGTFLPIATKVRDQVRRK